MKKVLFIMVVLGFCLSGCFTTNTSVCDDLKGQKSYLCETAEISGIQLEDIGNLLMIANIAAIESRAYSKEDAKEVFQTLHEMISRSPSYSYIRKEMLKRFNKYPGLFIIANSYMMKMDRPQMITNADKALLLAWLEEQIIILGN